LTEAALGRAVDRLPRRIGGFSSGRRATERGEPCAGCFLLP